MSDTTQLAKETIDLVVGKLDALGTKLGVAAGKVWEFSVKAKVVEAKRDIVQAAFLLLLPIMLFCWAGHVKGMNLAHRFHRESVFVGQTCKGVDDGRYSSGIWMNCGGGQKEEKTVDDGLTDVSQLYILSGFLALFIGVILFYQSVDGLIDGWASIHTCEADALDELLWTIRGDSE